MDADKKDALLAQEYLQLQKTVEDFDARALTIKAWSVTFSAAGLGVAYQQGIPILLLIASLSAATFWLIEATRKAHQHALYPRITAIESHFAGTGDSELRPLQISSGWDSGLRGLRHDWRWLKIPFLVGVMLPHVVIVAAGILLYFYYPPTPN